MTVEKGQVLNPRLRHEERSNAAVRLREGYEGGASIRELAARRGHSYGLTRALLIESGATLRPRGGVPALKA